LFSVPALRHFSSDAGASAIKICNPFFHSLFRYAFEEPRIMCSFLNAILDFKQDQLIQSIEYLPQESPSFYPRSPPSYQLFNLRCHSNHGRYILVSLQNNFQDNSPLKCNVGHLSTTNRSDDAETLQKQAQKFDKNTIEQSILSSECQGAYSIEIVNKPSSVSRMKEYYSDESATEPHVVNKYELRNVNQAGRRFEIIQYQAIVLSMGHLQKPACELSTLMERWVHVLNDPSKGSGSTQITATRKIEQPEVVAGGDPAILTFFDRLNIDNVPEDLKERYLYEINYYNGYHIGKERSLRKIASRMLNLGYSISFIIEVTGISPEDIKSK